MLTGIRLRNFKCFSALDLECSRLNLLTGINGTGKSSVIQMLLMLRQSIETRELLNGRMVLSGSRVELGTGVDVLYENAEADVIELGLSTDQKHSWNGTHNLNILDRLMNWSGESTTQTNPLY